VKKIALASLNSLFARLAEGRKLYLPIEKAGVVDYFEWNANEKVRLDVLKTVKSAKDVFFPQVEDLLNFRMQGKSIEKLFYYKGSLKRAFATLLIPIAMKKHAAIEPSMLQDLKKGKPCEIDAINGVVCEWGRKLNVKTPINDKIVEIVKQAQDGKIKLGRENIALFDELL